MNSLVSDLLLLARLDEGQDLDNADVDLTDLVVDAVNDAAVSAPEHRWLTSVPDAAVWVRGDYARLHQTIANLLSNARVHTPAGTTVTTGIATGRAGFVELTVTDDGPGIESDLLPHLFERFVRADKSRSRDAGSFGFGLSIAASIIEAHNGTIEAASDSGRTTFKVTLPTVARALSGGIDIDGLRGDRRDDGAGTARVLGGMRLARTDGADRALRQWCGPHSVDDDV
jgi:two-component system sensor histidine kinase TrcS